MATKDDKREVNYEELMKLPEYVVGELVGGQLHVSPRPASPHAMAANALAALLTPAFQFARGGPGGWVVLMEPELHFGREVVVPDLAAWRRERMPEMPDAPWFELAPDWVCEVLSPSTRRFDRDEKLPVYAAAGARHAWLIEPAEKTLEAFEAGGGAWRSLGSLSTPKVRVPPFEELDLELELLWSR